MLGPATKCAVIAVLLTGCGRNPLRARAPEAPTMGQTKCTLAANSADPLLIEWAEGDKRLFEERLTGGAVAVRFSGCEMRVVPGCAPGGRYTWRRTTPSVDTLSIRSADDLYARMPLGAVALEGKLGASSSLDMQTTVAGQLKLEGIGIRQVQREGACAEATHLVGSVSVGAFALASGNKLSARGSVEAPVAGDVSDEVVRRDNVIRRAGDPAVCADATDEAPADGCKAPLQAFLWELPWTRELRVAPVVPTTVAFRAEDPNDKWNVVDRGRKLCQTPCKTEVKSDSAVIMVDPDDSFLSPDDDVEVKVYEEEKGMSLLVTADTSSPALYLLSFPLFIYSGVGFTLGPLTASECSDAQQDCTGAVLLTTGFAAAGVGLLLFFLSLPDVTVEAAP